MSRPKRLRRQAAETDKAFGVTEMPAAEWQKRTAWANQLSGIATPAAGTSTKTLAKPANWEELIRSISACTACRLCETRTNTVPGDGSLKAKLMFIGEAPGAEEDKQGRPFVGRAGQLLTKMIEAMGLKREDVYIANCVKCRPPENRNPMPDEIALCNPFLRQQIDWIKPKVLCTLGKFATQTILQTETPITKLRGKWHEYNGVKLMPTYHPAYLLRNPSEKKTVWEDLKEVMRELGLKVPAAAKP